MQMNNHHKINTARDIGPNFHKSTSSMTSFINANIVDSRIAMGRFLEEAENMNEYKMNLN